MKQIIALVFIPVTRRVKGYTRFVEKYVTGRRKRFRPHKVSCHVRLSVCLSVRMNSGISETRRARLLRLDMQRKFDSAMCHAHKPPKTEAPTVLMLE